MGCLFGSSLQSHRAAMPSSRLFRADDHRNSKSYRAPQYTKEHRRSQAFSLLDAAYLSVIISRLFQIQAKQLASPDVVIAIYLALKSEGLFDSKSFGFPSVTCGDYSSAKK
ncbi:hypothetical protein O181_086489 [Austropuccinia psidii MF-1]|uniref:Uncharacterized protein n=1 Tax=Austropuccinia psidii MF-1 TaxID=1389203 RepID=A0A9Q3IND7_9BASI|nr:hypothetical protein [Austropuccinia psidii MF-1]